MGNLLSFSTFRINQIQPELIPKFIDYEEEYFGKITNIHFDIRSDLKIYVIEPFVKIHENLHGIQTLFPYVYNSEYKKIINLQSDGAIRILSATTCPIRVELKSGNGIINNEFLTGLLSKYQIEDMNHILLFLMKKIIHFGLQNKTIENYKIIYDSNSDQNKKVIEIIFNELKIQDKKITASFVFNHYIFRCM